MSQPSNQVTVTTDPPSSPINLALHRPTSESSHTQIYASSNATDGDTNTYWESANNAFPQWVQVDLGAVTGVRRIVLNLPPAAAWATRTQTISVQGSTEGGTFAQLLAPAGYTFDPATGNTATLTLLSTVTTRYVRLTFTANNGWPAGQVSEFQLRRLMNRGPRPALLRVVRNSRRPSGGSSMSVIVLGATDSSTLGDRIVTRSRSSFSCTVRPSVPRPGTLWPNT